LTIFRPCIDLHQGKVKQIVGGSLNQGGAKTNFISDKSAAFYADLYRQRGLKGGHIISLSQGNQQQTLSALAAYPGGMQYGGGVNSSNASTYLQAGASHVIVTSCLFENNQFSWQRLAEIEAVVGADKLVLDLSCRRTTHGWMIATNRWQTVTSTPVNPAMIAKLGDHCAELLVHGADVEGLQSGIDTELVSLLGRTCTVPCTYAGGATCLQDLERVKSLSGGKVDLTIGSALDIFGGSGITLEACTQWNSDQS
jgi:phosphoribosylformimino-5-aminoimidazole carboxamide ribotide isomerase